MSNLSLDAFRDAVRKNGPECGVGRIRKSLEGSDLVALDAALADPGITSSAIARVLQDAGHEISKAAVQYHQRGDCRCGKAEL